MQASLGRLKVSCNLLEMRSARSRVHSDSSSKLTSTVPCQCTIDMRRWTNTSSRKCMPGCAPLGPSRPALHLRSLDAVIMTPEEQWRAFDDHLEVKAGQALRGAYVQHAQQYSNYHTLIDMAANAVIAASVEEVMTSRQLEGSYGSYMMLTSRHLLPFSSTGSFTSGSTYHSPSVIQRDRLGSGAA